MAQKRMLDKKISVSEQVANLPLEAQLIFTWSIPHGDDIGLLPHSLRTLQATIVPMMPFEKIEDNRLLTFAHYWNLIIKEGLIEEFEHAGNKYFRIVSFLKNQTLKRDRQPNTLLKIPFSSQPKESWKILLDATGVEPDGIQMEDSGFHLDTEEKGSKGKRSKVKLSKEKGSKKEIQLDDESSPKAKATKFFEMCALPESTLFNDFLEKLHTRTKIPHDQLERELKKFVSYWTERNKSGSKMKWEIEQTFEIDKRLNKWFENASKWGREKAGVNNKYQAGGV